MNSLVSAEFGQYMVRLPLTKSAVIYHENALRIDWGDLIKKEHLGLDNSNGIVNEPPVDYIRSKRGERVKDEHFNYIIGNPPFIGSKMMSEIQRKDLLNIFGDVNGSGIMDYVSAWYINAAKYLKKYNDEKRKIKCAFVSTNSIIQGEQVGVLWGEMFNKYKIKIHFAHQTFKWSNEASGNAAVYCVIVGFSNFDTAEKYLYTYEDIKGEPVKSTVKNINSYLVEGKDVLVSKRSNPICQVPEVSFGNMPLDGGHFLLSNDEKIDFIKAEPKAKKYLKPLISAQEFLNGKNAGAYGL